MDDLQVFKRFFEMYGVAHDELRSEALMEGLGGLPEGAECLVLTVGETHFCFTVDEEFIGYYTDNQMRHVARVRQGG